MYVLPSVKKKKICVQLTLSNWRFYLKNFLSAYGDEEYSGVGLRVCVCGRGVECRCERKTQLDSPLCAA